MSLSMDDDGSSMVDADYSDFEYQFISGDLILRESQDSTGGTNVSATAVIPYDPLGDVGGLDNNEVAELVAMETTVAIEFEDETDDQNVATVAETRGAVGINLPQTGDALPAAGPEDRPDSVVFNNDIDESNVDAEASTRVDDRYLQVFEARGAAPFDDETNGPGGAGSQETFHNVKAFRQLTGRGPVIDNNDDLAIAFTANVGDTIITVSAVVRVHMIWDVAETSDAGRRFSVPMDD